MKLAFFLPLCLALFCRLALDPAQARSDQDRVEFNGCYAVWNSHELIVGNTQFERRWDVADTSLNATSFLLKTSGFQWLSPIKNTTNGHFSSATITAKKIEGNNVKSSFLRVSISNNNALAPTILIDVFPDASGTLVQWLPVQDNETNFPSSSKLFAHTDPNGSATLVESYQLAPEHLLLTQVTLNDQTDKHNELVFERNWLLSPNESAILISGNLFFVEDTISENGLIVLELAPLPNSRPGKTDADFRVSPRSRTIQIPFTRYPVVTLLYSGGRNGRIAALQRFQRKLRMPNATRDGLFLSNTWGDRSRDSRINEAFMLKEIVAGANLGVDVIQIDDGWQKGRTRNSASKGGVWGSWWSANPEFWQPDGIRFPHGLTPVVNTAKDHNMKVGLWFSPDCSKDSANWQRDEDQLFRLFRDQGVDYFKIDGLRTGTQLSVDHQRRLFDKLIDQSQGKAVFDLDVTADDRPGYFGMPDIGPVFLENRYTDSHNYWPHSTLRNLWELSQYLDPLRLRVEFLNNSRNSELYGADPLAPAKYHPSTLFAMTMVASPLGWFEVSNLPEEFVRDVKPLVEKWKIERLRLQSGTIIPIGKVPDGLVWSGFASVSTPDFGGYLLLFRELNSDPAFHVDLTPLFGSQMNVTVLGGQGTAKIFDNHLNVHIPQKLDFVWVRLEPQKSELVKR